MVFLALEILSLAGLIGNIVLLIIFVKYRHISKPSFILIASLTISDIIHGFVTSLYFYPPIVSRKSLYPNYISPIWNSIDWTAWGISLTHMLFIALDRCAAVTLPQQYSQMSTVRGNSLCVILCWLFFALTTLSYYGAGMCCTVVPVPEYYTFSFKIPANSTALNIYKTTFMPLEICSMLFLALLNPLTVVRLYRRYKERIDMKRVSVTLVALATSLTGDRGVSSSALSLQKAAWREVKVFIQIISVTMVFFAYMFNYYLFFYIVGMTNKWATMLNSLFYSITHIINPVVYMGINEQMHANFKDLFKLRRSDTTALSQLNASKSMNRSIRSFISPTSNQSLAPVPPRRSRIRKMIKSKSAICRRRSSTIQILENNLETSSYGGFEVVPESKLQMCNSENFLAMLAVEEEMICFANINGTGSEASFSSRGSSVFL